MRTNLHCGSNIFESYFLFFLYNFTYNMCIELTVEILIYANENSNKIKFPLITTNIKVILNVSFIRTYINV